MESNPHLFSHPPIPVNAVTGREQRGDAGGRSGCGGGRDEAEPRLGPGGRLAAAVCLGSLGFCSNLLVLPLLWRFPALRSPINLQLLNVALSGLLGCALGTPLGLAAGNSDSNSSNNGNSSNNSSNSNNSNNNSNSSNSNNNSNSSNSSNNGNNNNSNSSNSNNSSNSSNSNNSNSIAPGAACAWHGFATALCGIMSLISLAVLSYEGCCTMTRTAEPDTTNYRKAWAAIILSWTYSLLWTVPPLLGWSSYGPEGAGITCSVNWHSRDANNASYIICLFIFCLVIPFAIIIYSYGKLLCAVRQFYRCFVELLRCNKHPQSSLSRLKKQQQTPGSEELLPKPSQAQKRDPELGAVGGLQETSCM
ncbi:opsin-3-like [Molothrus aeneus]|uniref:opsin-3-like n=1 Tax=Molothrus aeneus TaxID=84833 RepID=UPI003457FB17